MNLFAKAAAAAANANSGLLASLTPIAAAATGYKGKAFVGTGIKKLITWGASQHPSLVTPVTIEAIVPSLPGIFGAYPANSHTEERIPAIIMIAFFSVMALANLYVFLRNVANRHYFFFSFGMAFFSLCKVCGYALRYKWSENVANLNVGIASVVFIQVAQLVFLVLNQILAHRIFTWRHPETGTSWWVNMIFNVIYFLVLGIIAMAIIGQSLPYIYFMSEHTFNICTNVMKAAAILNLLYAGLPFTVIFLAFAFKPGSLSATPWKSSSPDRVLPPVAQANWIHSADMFYFVPRGAQQTIYKDQPAARAIRIIPSREPPAGGVHELHHEPMHPDSPRLSVAVLVVLTSTFVFLLNTCLRVAACFRHGPIGDANQFFPHASYTMYIFYGGTEILVLALFLIARVDLRFYIPDMARSAGKNPNPYNGSDYNEPKPLEAGYSTPPEGSHL